MVGMMSGVCYTKPWKCGWWNKLVVIDEDEVLIISFVMTRIKLSVLEVDNNK